MKGEIKVNNVQFTYENKDYLGAEFRLIIPLESKKHSLIECF